MIILDADRDPQKRRLSRRSTDDVESIRSDVSGRPPSYRSNNSTNWPRLVQQPAIGSFDTSSIVSKEKPGPSEVKRAETRFWKGLLYALAIYAVVSIAIAVPYFVTQSHKPQPDYDDDGDPSQRNHQPNNGKNTPPIVVQPEGNPPADGKVISCNAWDTTHDYGYPTFVTYARLTYCIPKNATNVWVHAIGGESSVSGTFTSKLNEDDEEDDYYIDVMVSYNKMDPAARDSSAVCLMQQDDSWGLGIYTPNDTQHTVDLQLTLLIPPNPSSPMQLPQFSTGLPSFPHFFEDLNGTLTYGSVNVSGPSTPISGSINADHINISTISAPIVGSFRATNSLILQTSGGKIDADITLSNKAGQEFPTSLYMKSSEGPFSATVTLAQDDSSNTTIPQYTTSVECTDSPVTMIFRHDESVNSSALDVQVNTTLNRAMILLDSKFEGNFDLYSNDGSVLVTDLHGNQVTRPGMFSGPIQEPLSQRRSLSLERRTSTHAAGCVARGDPDDIRRRDSAQQKANIRVYNNMALVAMGFVNPDDSTTLSSLGFVS